MNGKFDSKYDENVNEQNNFRLQDTSNKGFQNTYFWKFRDRHITNDHLNDLLMALISNNEINKYLYPLK